LSTDDGTITKVDKLHQNLIQSKLSNITSFNITATDMMQQKHLQPTEKQQKIK